MNSPSFNLIKISLVALATIACAVLWNEVLSVMFELSELYVEQPYLKLGWLRTLEVITIFILWGKYRMSIFGESGQRLKDVLWGLGISATGLIGIYGCHLLAMNIFDFDLWGNARSPDSSHPLPHLVFFGILAGPLCEEVFFRATLWRQLKLDSYSWPCKVYAGLWMMILFSGLHFDLNTPWQEQTLGILVWSSCGALSFGLYWWRKSTLTPWIVHGFANAVLLWPI